VWSEVRALRESVDYGTPPRDGDPVTLTVDGVTVTVAARSSVMLAAAACSRPIPRLCATDSLEAFGSCRVCLVEIEGRKGFPAACTTLVEPDMVVHTRTPALDRLRKGVLELYLSDFPPEDVPGGWSELHEVLEAVGVTGHPYGDGRTHLDAAIDTSNPYFVFDPAKCIVCSRCVRACEEIQGTFALTIERRGFESRVVAGQAESFLQSECVSCGACVQACPTQSLIEKSLFDGDYVRANSPQT